ncbi:MAG: hypothetical protein K2L82_14085 [Lachnospiraceae bacterium]|nr:hypothetical protein [Lachnospiraceae bacterium]
MKNNLERLAECLNCKYLKFCTEKVDMPEDYPDGTCKTKDLLKKSSGGKYDNRN